MLLFERDERSFKALVCPVLLKQSTAESVTDSFTFSPMSSASLQSRNSVQQGNLDGARRLGRNAMILSIVSILGGIAIITAAIVLNWGCEYQPMSHSSNLL